MNGKHVLMMTRVALILGLGTLAGAGEFFKDFDSVEIIPAK